MCGNHASVCTCHREGDGNPLQCSCLENPRDGGAWWAAVYGVHRIGHDWRDLAAAAAAINMDTIQKKPEDMTIVGKDMENLESLCTVDGNVKWWSAMENIIAILQDIKSRMTRWFSHSTWYRPQRTDSTVLKRYLYIHIRGSLIHNSQNVETIQISINRKWNLLKTVWDH